MNGKPTLESLFAAAREHSPFGEAPEFGFETRLLALLSETRPGVADYLASFSWRFAAASLPLAVAVLAFLALQHQHGLPDGFGGVVAQWTGLLPFGL